MLKKAMIMAAGVGSRLEPLSSVVPKPLVPLANVPTMDILVKHLASFGINNIVANTFHKAEAIQEHYKKNNFGVNFEFIKCDLGENEHPNTVKMEMVLEDGSTSIVKGASIGGGNVKLTEIDGLSLDFNGARPAVILEIKDIPGAVSFVTGLLAHNNKNIAMMSTNKPAGSQYTFVTIETDEELDNDILEQIKKFEVVAKAVVLDRF